MMLRYAVPTATDGLHNILITAKIKQITRHKPLSTSQQITHHPH
ncbi:MULTISPECIES: hypothetical protein [Methanobacterium]|nr:MULTISPECIES: hypothetical protein [Methanobacterium]